MGALSGSGSHPSRCWPMLIAALAIYFKELFFSKKAGDGIRTHGAVIFLEPKTRHKRLSLEK